MAVCLKSPENGGKGTRSLLRQKERQIRCQSATRLGDGRGIVDSQRMTLFRLLQPPQQARRAKNEHIDAGLIRTDASEENRCPEYLLVYRIRPLCHRAQVVMFFEAKCHFILLCCSVMWTGRLAARLGGVESEGYRLDCGSGSSFESRLVPEARKTANTTMLRGRRQGPKSCDGWRPGCRDS